MSGAGELAMFLAIGRRLGGRVDPGDTSGQTEEVREPVTAEVDDLPKRLAEVEERLDFAERLLAHGAVANQLPGGPRQ